MEIEKEVSWLNDEELMISHLTHFGLNRLAGAKQVKLTWATWQKYNLFDEFIIVAFYKVLVQTPLKM